jgi:hypothetical protein
MNKNTIDDITDQLVRNKTITPEQTEEARHLLWAADLADHWAVGGRRMVLECPIRHDADLKAHQIQTVLTSRLPAHCLVTGWNEQTKSLQITLQHP